MRTLGDADTEITTYSSRASENVRALAFAGLAFVWLIAPSLSEIHGVLRWAAGLLVVALFADFAHYVIGWATWDFFILRRTENALHARGERPTRETPAEYDDSVLRWIDWAYYFKIIAVVAAYGMLLVAVVSRIGAPSPPPPVG